MMFRTSQSIIKSMAPPPPPIKPGVPPPHGSAKGEDAVLKLKPHWYLHVLDNNANVTRVEVGPQTLTRKEHERIVEGPVEMISIPPRHYAVIANPVARASDGLPVYDSYGQVLLLHGDLEIRLTQDPFPLFPGESLVGEITQLLVVASNEALRLKALRDFKSEELGQMYAGDEWLFEGPATYYPRVDVQILQTVRAKVIKPNQALRLRAKKACVDSKGNNRSAGEEWLMREVGAYMPGIDEVVVGEIQAYILTERTALHLRATRNFVDQFMHARKPGEEWLVRHTDSEAVIPGVYEEVVGLVNLITLSRREYCVVRDPVDKNGKPQLGRRELRKGPESFFLQPGEALETGGIQPVHVLAEDEALLLRALESLEDSDKVGAVTKRNPGDRWMVHGPRDFIPPVEVEIVEKRTAIPLDENEGIYVRDISDGKVRAVKGQSYMLRSNEELWEKELPPAVEQLLARELEADSVTLRTSWNGNAVPAARSEKWRMVTYQAPHNSAVQIYDYKEKQARVVFGPDLVLLGPDEHFTVLSISGGRPKKSGQLKALALLLGPDFMTDVITVETSDHARLQLQLSYNWHFDCDKKSTEDATKIFSVPDFIGDACKAVASRVRGAVAQVAFDNFHKNSASVIRAAVFGKDEKQFVFPANKLVLTNIDIQAVEPVDSKTRESLQKSVQLAISITTQSQEASARQEAERTEQEARGRLERQKIQDEALAEKARRELLTLQVESATIESSGTAKAEAQARAQSAEIDGEAQVMRAKLRARALDVESRSQFEMLKIAKEAEIAHQAALDRLEIERCKALSEIESKKFEECVSAIGTETLAAIASAGGETQAKLLQGLGIQSMLITDGNSPINLFNAASGLLGNASQ
ncbi:hypothetical protein AB1Y20_020887 [Prymnesium parvum]|uniref:Major vault protein n=1 Tax=Prymnesium parvum TaxID=97485 RepID=A0AB34JZD3_PRYPA